MELIDREAVIKVIHNNMQKHMSFLEHDALIDVEFEVDELPSVEPAKGEWIDVDGDWRNSKTDEPLTVLRCSECGNCFIHAPYNYCPECGADMRGNK